MAGWRTIFHPPIFYHEVVLCMGKKGETGIIQVTSTQSSFLSSSHPSLHPFILNYSVVLCASVVHNGNF